MSILNNYLKYLNEQTGYLNYVEDRYLISQKLDLKIKKCMHTYYPSTPNLRISLYRCQLKALKVAISKYEKAKSKCEYTRMPDKCELFYQNMITNIEHKIQFFNNEISNLLRKINKVKY